MSREQWYVVTKIRGLNSSLGAIDGIRLADKIAYPGVILPGKWFNYVSDEDFQNILVGGYGIIAPYQPSANELPLLYTLFPATRPKTALKRAEYGGLSLKNKWYKIADHKAMLWGVAALCKVDGVCSAGETAFAGDIVPAQWFAGLSLEQISCLERGGVHSEQWLQSQSREFRANYTAWQKPTILRVSPSSMELPNLYAKFPGADPNRIAPKVEEEEVGE